MGTEALRQPAEWSPHDAVWLAWPSHEALWGAALPEVRRSFTAFARAITRDGGERLEVLCPDDAQEDLARVALDGLDARFHRIPFGDIWLRDTAPVFMHDPSGAVVAVRFAFNGWGGKYELAHDTEVSARVAAAAGCRVVTHDFAMEGGSVEVDGEGTALSSRQCLLNPNRNPAMDEAAVTRAVLGAFGAERLLWVTDGLLNDHTDGHIDTIARFVAPGVVALMEPSGADDPNREVLRALRDELSGQRDARGRALELVFAPSPGRVEDGDGRVMPASHLNFYIGNRAVVVPTYRTAFDDAAGRAVEAMFPGRRVEVVDALPILRGGGAFHCISQQQPSRRHGAGR
ncbi:MAG: agmatine deiminase family protein [Deltaproteobacteria bacterium]|nr:agmatine deiminase family protein [Deltaproteobacteria bacterium]